MDVDTKAQKLDAYLRKHENRRTGEVKIDQEKIEQETGLTLADQYEAARYLSQQVPRKWGFSFE